MTFAASFEIDEQCMVMQIFRQFNSLGKHGYDTIQLVKWKIAFLGKTIVLLELRCKPDFVFHAFKAFNRLSISW